MRAFLLLLPLDHSATSHQSRCVYFLRRYHSILYMGGLDFSLLPGSGPGECDESVNLLLTCSPEQSPPSPLVEGSRIGSRGCGAVIHSTIT